MNSITVTRPVKVVPPRASHLAAVLFSRALRWFERSEQARAERRGRASRASEAADVRAYAQRFLSHDPRYAADLLAAADRHEAA